MSLVVACYFWHPDPGSKFTAGYTPDDVRALQRMVKRHLSVKHEFAVITDRPHLFDGDKDIRAIPLNRETHVPGTCFAKLFTFHPNGKYLIGERVFVIDLDTLVVGNIDHIVDRDEDLVLWRNPSRVPWDGPVGRTGRPLYNTSFVLHRCGTKPFLHSCFDPNEPKCRDDQWWISNQCGPDMPYWDGSYGVYRIAREDTPGSGVSGALPENAVLVTAPGSEGKFTEPHIAATNPWIAKHNEYWDLARALG
jgi:hypothetical protein